MWVKISECGSKFTLKFRGAGQWVKIWADLWARAVLFSVVLTYRGISAGLLSPTTQKNGSTLSSSMTGMRGAMTTTSTLLRGRLPMTTSMLSSATTQLTSWPHWICQRPWELRSQSSHRLRVNRPRRCQRMWWLRRAGTQRARTVRDARRDARIALVVSQCCL